MSNIWKKHKILLAKPCLDWGLMIVDVYFDIKNVTNHFRSNFVGSNSTSQSAPRNMANPEHGESAPPPYRAEENPFSSMNFLPLN